MASLKIWVFVGELVNDYVAKPLGPGLTKIAPNESAVFRVEGNDPGQISQSNPRSPLDHIRSQQFLKKNCLAHVMMRRIQGSFGTRFLQPFHTTHGPLKDEPYINSCSLL